MYEPKFWIFLSFLSLVNTYTFSNKTYCQTLNSTEIKKITIDSYKTESIKPHKIFEVITNFLGVFSQNEKSLNYQKYKKFQSSVDCYNEGCQFLTVYHYLNLNKKEFDHFQTKDTIDKLSCILNNKVYSIKFCIKIFEKLNLKLLETPNIKPKYIRINSNGTLTLTNTTETTLLCTCGIQHNNLNEEKKFYISSIKTTILSFLKNIKILIEEVPIIQKEMLGKINCTNEYKKLQNNEKNSLYETIFLTKITFK